MLRRTFLVILAILGCVLPGIARGQIETFNVIPAFAPKGPSSPGWTGYVTNALTGIKAGGATVGDRGTSPDGYEAVTSMLRPAEMIYTDYPSWQGSADPSTRYASFDPVFQAENGNRIHFGLHIVTEDGETFALDQLDWSLNSDDDEHYFDQAGTFAGQNYSPTRIGINYGADMMEGGGDDIVYDNGEAGTNEIHEFIYVGVGDGFNASPVPGFEQPDDQGEINEVLRLLLDGCSADECEVNLTATYTLNDPDIPHPVLGSGSVAILIQAGLGGDFSHDGIIDCDDADLLTQAVASGDNDIIYDLTNDGLVNFHDLLEWVDEVRHTYLGDANCDGEFNSTDLVKVFQKAKYETGLPAVWSSGDWNGDGLFDSGDLVVAFQQGGYEKGPRWVDAEVVPEPGSVVLTLIGILVFAFNRQRSSTVG